MSPRRGVAPLRRAAIVRATIRCLARDGYSGLTMKRVAREAKVSQGILHYYFRDKRTILVAALETVAADLDRHDVADGGGGRVFGGHIYAQRMAGLAVGLVGVHCAPQFGELAGPAVPQGGVDGDGVNPFRRGTHLTVK